MLVSYGDFTHLCRLVLPAKAKTTHICCAQKKRLVIKEGKLVFPDPPFEPEVIGLIPSIGINNFYD